MQNVIPDTIELLYYSIVLLIPEYKPLRVRAGRLVRGSVVILLPLLLAHTLQLLRLHGLFTLRAVERDIMLPRALRAGLLLLHQLLGRCVGLAGQTGAALALADLVRGRVALVLVVGGCLAGAGVAEARVDVGRGGAADGVLGRDAGGVGVVGLAGDFVGRVGLECALLGGGAGWEGFGVELGCAFVAYLTAWLVLEIECQ